MGEEGKGRGTNSRDSAQVRRAGRVGTSPRGDQALAHGGRLLAKSGDLVREGRAVKYAAIADWVDTACFSVNFMCAQLGVSRSGYYAWRSRDPSAHETQDAMLTRLIHHFFERLRGNPGVRRMHAELAAGPVTASPASVSGG